ncbi:MAG: sigma-70 family RNA polymerase sigma factor [Clostridia bacterium]|nr:sigma-70 family RNA polymerase sigma factor [Clostridia bacterium]
MDKPTRYSNFRFREIAEEYIHSDRDRRILIEKFCNKKTIEQIAERFELSVSQVKRVIVRDGETVFGIMAEDEPKRG